MPGKARRFFRRTWTVLPAVLALAAPARAQGQRAPQPPPPPPLENRRELGLSAAQNRALRQLEKTSDATANHLHRRLDGLRAELDRSYRVYALNAARIAALHRQIQGTQADLLRTRLDTQKRLRGILTAHQFRALQTLLPPPPPEPPQPPRPPMPPYAPPPPPPPYAPRPPHAPRAPRPAPAPRPR